MAHHRLHTAHRVRICMETSQHRLLNIDYNMHFAPHRRCSERHWLTLTPHKVISHRGVLRYFAGPGRQLGGCALTASPPRRRPATGPGRRRGGYVADVAAPSQVRRRPPSGP
eukprot:9488121-Pyramimonas_sp.AAC.1